MGIYLRNLAVAGALAIAATGALANDVGINITVTGGTTLFGALHTDAFDFTDVFTFSKTDVFTFSNVAGPVTANASLITIGDGAHNIELLSANLNGSPLTLSPNRLFETRVIWDTALTGPLVLTVTGKSGATGGIFASYSGSISDTINVSPIPEPQTWGMLLAGIVGIALMARQRLGV